MGIKRWAFSSSRALGFSLLFLVVCGVFFTPALGDPFVIYRTAQMPEDTTITGMAKWKVERTGHFMFTAAAGKKIHFNSKSQKLVVDCEKIEGNWVGNPKNAVLETATMTGGVEATITRASQNQKSTQPQTTTITGDTATFTNTEYALHVIGGVHVTSDDPGAQQTMVLTGASADVELTRPNTAGRAVRSATLDGPVKFEVHGFREDSSGGAARRLPFQMHGVADRAQYNDAARTVTLIGHVHISGDDPTLGGEQYADKETIKLAEDGSIDSVEGEGSPGTTKFSPRTTGGGGKQPR